MAVWHVCVFSTYDYACHSSQVGCYNVILLASNVITLMLFSYYGLLSAYVQVCIRYEYL